MIKSKRAVALTLAFGGFAACPALAQYQSPPPMNRSLPDPPAATEAVPAAPGRKYDLSKAARKAIVELQTAVNANDTANIAAKLAAAQAVAKTADDKLVIGQLQLKAAVNQKNDAAIGAALEAMLASGAAGPGDALPLHTNLGKHYFNSKQYDRAASQFERVLALDPSNSEAILLFAETRRVQGRAPEAVALLQKAIAASTAAGRKPSEDLYKHAVQLSYDAKLPTAIPLSREWVATYPTPANWSAALRIYQRGSGLDNDVLIDLMRLQRANGALAGESDYFNYANTALLRGYPGEAKAVLEEGFAAKKIDRSKPIFRDVLAEASSKAAADRASLTGLEATALASPSAKQAMVTGDAYLGYGEWAKAAALYRAALTKSGVDPNVANLRLGIALARSGDKAGATTAFNAVSGTRADIAKYWLLYLSTRA